MQQFMPGYINPYMSAQQRLNFMEQQYPNLAQPQMQQTPVNTNLVTIPVSNIDEANAFRVDLNGTPTFFYNAGKNEVYFKRTNTQTGAADFKTFQLVAEPLVAVKEKISTNTYEKDFKALNDKIDGFNAKIDGLYSLLATVQVEPKSEQVTEQVSEQVKTIIAKGGKNVK